jgi:NAD(P)-dependent dehydrogenase (short-subunit alcohol dehydrogenase family)
MYSMKFLTYFNIQQIILICYYTDFGISIMKLENAVVLVTGASSGIGKSIALKFDAEGAMVALAARRAEKLNETASKMKNPFVIPTDISDYTQAREMVVKTISNFGRIDILINNAAAIIVSRSDDLTPEDMLKAYRTNVIGPIIATNEAVSHMRKQGLGHIINVGSPGFMIGVPLYGPYVCSKAAMSAWTRTIQAEWRGTGIIVSEYFPGYIMTDSPAESSFGPIDQDAVIDRERNFITKFFTKPGTPEGVAAQIVNIARNPRILTYSSRTGSIGSWLSNITSLRIRIAAGMAKNIRKRLNLSVFSR